MSARPRILCLDDERYVLEGLNRNLRSGFEVVITTDPNEALRVLATSSNDPFAVFVSDMRMPGMNGVGVLEKAREVAPETTRMLLTGDADIQSAADAINRGNIFRFILKPCPADQLRVTIGAGVEQHHLVRAERVLLEDTLKGCVDALMDTLAMAQPDLFSRASRLRRITGDLCEVLRLENAWQVEMAAQLGEIGAITLPPDAVNALQSGLSTSAKEADMIAALPRVAMSVLRHIPRLDAVQEIIRYQLPTDRNPVTAVKPEASDRARLLQVVREYDALVYRGMPPDLALAALGVRKVHPMEYVQGLAKVSGLRLPNEAIREIPVEELAIGHEISSDLRTSKGLLLVARGQVINETLLRRVHNFNASTSIDGKVLIVDC